MKKVWPFVFFGLNFWPFSFYTSLIKKVTHVANISDLFHFLQSLSKRSHMWSKFLTFFISLLNKYHLRWKPKPQYFIPTKMTQSDFIIETPSQGMTIKRQDTTEDERLTLTYEICYVDNLRNILFDSINSSYK